MKQFTAVIIDDEKNNRENLLYMLTKYCPNIKVVGQAVSAIEGIQLIKTEKPVVVFLDIEMPGINGFEMLSEFESIEFQVIFVTAFDSYALDAIKFSALDYILKPIDKIELTNAVDKVEKAERIKTDQLSNLNTFLKGGQQKIALSLADEIRLIELKQIVRIEADNNYCEFKLKAGESIIVSKHLGYYFEILKTKGFIRIHQSHLVNQIFIERFIKKDGGYLLLSNKEELPVSRTQKDHVLNFFSDL